MFENTAEAGTPTLVKRVCSECKKTRTSENKRKWKDGTIHKYPHWYRDMKGGWLCKICFENTRPYGSQTIRKRLVDIICNGEIPSCKRCGIDDLRVLQLDHVNGGGLQEVKKFGRVRWMYRYYMKLPKDEARSKLQLLCANCNIIKYFESNSKSISM